MIIKMHYLKLTLALILSFSVVTLTIADTPATPYDYKKVTTNNQYIFVMLHKSAWADKNRELRSLYKQSGLYLNNGSNKPLWTVDWYAYEIIPSSDGEHLIRFGPWASSGYQLAIAFYNKGKEIKQYKIMDLVKDEKKLTYTASHFFWRSEEIYNDKLSTLLLKTHDGQTYTFSVLTGLSVK